MKFYIKLKLDFFIEVLGYLSFCIKLSLEIFVKIEQNSKNMIVHLEVVKHENNHWE